MALPAGESDATEQGPPEATDEMEQLRQAVMQLQYIVRQLVARPPVHMSVAHMAVQHLAFNVAGIDVEELSGQLNLGMNHLLQVARPETPEGPTAAPEPPQERPQEPPASQLWPPESGEDEQA